jgi:hypothetical protein
MNEPTTYLIVVEGRASARLLRPLLDDFTVDHEADGTTHLVGQVSDAAHLHGILAHLTAVNAQLISISRLSPAATAATEPSNNTNPDTTTKEASNQP